MGDAVKQAVQWRTIFTWTKSNDQATTREQRQEPEEGQASAQARAKKPKTRKTMRVADKAIEDRDQERHEQSNASDGTKTMAPEIWFDAPRMLHFQKSAVQAY